MKNVKNAYDVVIIGAGNSGLIAATVCASKGYKTLLVEQHNLPGGFASSFVRGRFEFEVALHELGNLGDKDNVGDIYSLFDELGIKVNWKKINNAFRLIVNNDDIKLDCCLPFGKEEFAKKCDEYEPGCYQKVIDFIDVCQNCYDAVRYIKSTKGKPDSEIIKSLYPNYLTCSIYTLNDLFKKLKLPKKIQYIIGSYWTYLGGTPKQINASLFCIMFFEYINFYAYIPQHRSHEISQAIVSRFQELGGHIWYNAEALKIDVKDNKVVGLDTSKGYIKTKHIISSASPHIVYGKMIDNNLIPEIDKKITSYRKPGSQGFCIYLGLNKSVEQLGIDEYSYFIYSEYNHEKIYKKMNSIKDNCDYIVIALNIANPDCSPKNTTILSFTTLYNDAWNNIEAKDYFKIKNEIADKMITDFEKKTGIKIKDSIEEIEVATPITFARYTKSANGAIYGYKSTLNDSTYVRARNIDNFYTIKGLRFCGGNGVTAHGYSITYISGNIVAGKTLSDIREEKNE